MGFSNKQETNLKAAPAPTEEAVLARIAFLGKKKAELEASVAEYDAVALDVHALRGAKELAISELAALRSEKDSLGAQISERLEKLDQITSLSQSKEDELGKSSVAIAANLASVAELTAASGVIRADLTALEARRTSLESSVSEKNDLVLSATKDLESVRAEIASLTSEMSQRKAVFSGEIASLTNACRVEEEKLQGLKDGIALATRHVDSVTVEADRILTEANSKAAEIIAQASSREVELASREGKVSLQEADLSARELQIENAKAFILDKTESLRQARAEFEQVRTAPVTDA